MVDIDGQVRDIVGRVPDDDALVLYGDVAFLDEGAWVLHVNARHLDIVAQIRHAAAEFPGPEGSVPEVSSRALGLGERVPDVAGPSPNIAGQVHDIEKPVPDIGTRVRDIGAYVLDGPANFRVSSASFPDMGGHFSEISAWSSCAEPDAPSSARTVTTATAARSVQSGGQIPARTRERDVPSLREVVR